jgi:hypothetical protein
MQLQAKLLDIELIFSGLSINCDVKIDKVRVQQILINLI